MYPSTIFVSIFKAQGPEIQNIDSRLLGFVKAKSVAFLLTQMFIIEEQRKFLLAGPTERSQSSMA